MIFIFQLELITTGTFLISRLYIRVICFNNSCLWHKHSKLDKIIWAIQCRFPICICKTSFLHLRLIWIIEACMEQLCQLIICLCPLQVPHKSSFRQFCMEEWNPYPRENLKENRKTTRLWDWIIQNHRI